MRSLIIFFLFPLKLFAQDITGLWTGAIHTTDKDLPYELVISESNGKLSGYSHTTFTVNGVQEVGVKAVTIKNKNGKVVVEDEALIFNSYSEDPVRRVRQFDYLSLITEDAKLMLNGTFKTNMVRQFRSINGSVQLTKTDTSKKTKIIPKLQELNLLNTLSFLQPKTIVKEAFAIQPKPEEKIIPLEPAPKKVDSIVVARVIPSDAFLKVKQIATTISIIKKPRPIVITAPKPKDVAVTAMPAVIKPPPLPVQKEKPKPIVIASAPPLVKKDQSFIAVQAPKATIIQSEKKEVKPEPVVTSVVSAAEVSKRKTETIQSVYFKSDSLVISLYDNGEVDGDTVSVILNGKVILANQGLTTNAITKTIYITPDLGDSLQLVMYAENLGSIPPNTGLLILMDGNDRYEIRFAGDFQKNSAVILKRRHGINGH